jgi:hypothetical protein
VEHVEETASETRAHATCLSFRRVPQEATHIDARYKLDDKVDREKRAEEREGASEGDTQGAPRRKNAQI